MSIGQEHMLLVSSVAKPCFDYVALGHIHRHQVLSEAPPVVYSGSLERLDFGDEDDEKGFYMVEIENATQKRWTQFEFRGVSGRRFLRIKVDVSLEDIDPTQTILKTVANSRDEISGNIVRLEISLPRECEGRVDENTIRQAASEAYYFSIVKNVTRQSRPRLGDMAVEGISPTDALQTYVNLNNAEFGKQNAARLVVLGKNIIQGGNA
jgi:exonuclease SbcD